ncbi:DUF1885 family protein [Paenibacillus eucommiae]|uniref:DUF1885 family protein n=1 Tax=Paenibacillus eucommiae TaxID=1355755 RepID=A0ABS4IYN5_9BACL|nr:DUF1885 family protein [Paenibacillus eucommiae]MBP1992705.1 hypothetical protein [Paenibacillus eucommiae]
MGQSAYIKLVTGSAVPALSLDELKEKLLHYRDQLSKTAEQLGWEYDEAGFPYTIETKPEADNQWFYLKGTNPLYKYIVFGVGKKQVNETDQHFVQVVLPDDATHGDKSKGNELCKHLGKQLKAELHLFNGRIMYFNPRK